MSMHKIQKIRGHIKMLEFQKLKLERYQSEEQANPNPKYPLRGQDIARALKRVTEQLNLWDGKLKAFETQPPRPADRGSVLDQQDSGRPLIG